MDGLITIAGTRRARLGLLALLAGLGLGAAQPAAAQTVATATAAPAPQTLHYFKNFFVTGDYVATGVALRGRGVKGLATGTLTVDPASIPTGAEIVAAYLFWETIASAGGATPATIAGARFRKNDLTGNAVLTNPGGTLPCRCDDDESGSARGSRATYVYRADVLRYFPRTRPADPTKPVQVQVAGSHEVVLPDSGSATALPSTLGAGLVVVYRVPGYDPASGYGAPLQPLRSIVIYDGGQRPDDTTHSVTTGIEGFYEASRTAPNAKLSMFVGNGRGASNDLVQIASTQVPADLSAVAVSPFVGAGGIPGLTSQGFDAPTFTALPLEAGAMKAVVNVVATDSDDHSNCPTIGAVILSTVVQDRDGDGLLDVWESQAEWANKPPRLAAVYPAWPLTDPNGVPLPNLQAMGASPDVQDLFLQVDYMTGTAHSHLPTRAALDSVTTALRNAAPRPSLVAAGLCAATATAGQCPINVHFDVGTAYQPAATVSPASCAVAATWTTDCAIIPASAGTKGGNLIAETPCAAPVCPFPSYPGTVGWKTGFRGHRDRLVDPVTRLACVKGQAGCEPRFLHNRKDIFHYALFAHAIGIPSLTDPTVPRKNSGIADTAGGDLMITLGLWDNQTGSDFVQGATLLHELGHNLGLHHGGVVPGGALQPNCKVNYQSVMNYLFQVSGLLTAQGVPALDFSRQLLPGIDETVGLSETAGLGSLTYLARWYAPAAGNFLATGLGVSPAVRHCDGSPITDGAKFVRVDADPRVLSSATPTAIDWNGDGAITAPPVVQDVNFDGQLSNLGAGANDFYTMDLRQVGGRRSVGSQTLSRSVVDPASGLPIPSNLPAIGGGLSLDSGYGDLGYGDLGYGDLGYGDLGYGDLGYGDLGYGDLGYGDLGYGDLGYGDLGYGDLGVPAEAVVVPGKPPIGGGEINLETAATLAGPPSGLTGAVVGKVNVLAWHAPAVGTPTQYQVWRVAGTAVTPATFAKRALVATVPGTQTTYSDKGKHNVTYTYFVTATVPDPSSASGGTLQTGPSNFVTITIVCKDNDH